MGIVHGLSYTGLQNPMFWTVKSSTLCNLSLTNSISLHFEDEYYDIYLHSEKEMVNGEDRKTIIVETVATK